MQVTDEMVEAACNAFMGTNDLLGAQMRTALTAALAKAWRPIESAPRTGEKVLVFYDHESDPYHETETRLTSYGTHSEGGDFLDGQGICVAQWVDGWHESEDEYGSGYWMPGWWFAHFNGDAELAVAPTHWMPLPEPPATKEAGER